MIRRHVMAALRAGVAAGDDAVARSALAKADWVLRGPARRRLEHALLDAALATGVLDTNVPEAARHWLAAAAVLVEGRRDLDLADRDAVARAYGELPARRPLRVPVATVCATLVAALLVAALLSAAAVRTEPVFARPDPPPPAGVFRDGGAPARDPEIERVLAELPLRLRGGPQLAALAQHPAFARHGAALRDAWTGLITCAVRWHAALESADREGSGFRRLSHELRARSIAVTDQLTAAQLGYYIDATILPEHGRRPPGVSTYQIEQVSFVRAGRRLVRVFGLRRIDARDNIAALGISNDELADPVVLLGQVDEKVRYQILPVLAGAPFPLGSMGTARERELARIAGDAIRRELYAALGPDATDIERRCRKLVAASVGRHEAQHVLDLERELPHPQALVDVLGRSDRAFALRARLELSAYLSQIASDIWLPQLVLWNLTRHAFRDGPHGIEEAYVATVIIAGLARRLRAGDGDLIRPNGDLDRDRLSSHALQLASVDTLALRSAAAALWAELFGEPLVRIYDDL